MSATSVAQTTGSNLRQLVEQMQQHLKPTVGQKPPVSIRDAPAYNQAGEPMPLFLNNHLATLDSLNRYTIDELDELRVEKGKKSNALFGTAGNWGTIYVRLKSRKQKS